MPALRQRGEPVDEVDPFRLLARRGRQPVDEDRHERRDDRGHDRDGDELDNRTPTHAEPSLMKRTETPCRNRNARSAVQSATPRELQKTIRRETREGGLLKWVSE